LFDLNKYKLNLSFINNILKLSRKYKTVLSKYCTGFRTSDSTGSS